MADQAAHALGDTRRGRPQSPKGYTRMLQPSQRKVMKKKYYEAMQEAADVETGEGDSAELLRENNFEWAVWDDEHEEFFKAMGSRANKDEIQQYCAVSKRGVLKHHTEELQRQVVWFVQMLRPEVTLQQWKDATSDVSTFYAHYGGVVDMITGFSTEKELEKTTDLCCPVLYIVEEYQRIHGCHPRLAVEDVGKKQKHPTKKARSSKARSSEASASGASASGASASGASASGASASGASASGASASGVSVLASSPSEDSVRDFELQLRAEMAIGVADDDLDGNVNNGTVAMPLPGATRSVPNAALSVHDGTRDGLGLGDFNSNPPVPFGASGFNDTNEMHTNETDWESSVLPSNDFFGQLAMGTGDERDMFAGGAAAAAPHPGGEVSYGSHICLDTSNGCREYHRYLHQRLETNKTTDTDRLKQLEGSIHTLRNNLAERQAESMSDIQTSHQTDMDKFNAMIQGLCHKMSEYTEERGKTFDHKHDLECKQLEERQAQEREEMAKRQKHEKEEMVKRQKQEKDESREHFKCHASGFLKTMSPMKRRFEQRHIHSKRPAAALQADERIDRLVSESINVCEKAIRDTACRYQDIIVNHAEVVVREHEACKRAQETIYETTSEIRDMASTYIISRDM